MRSDKVKKDAIRAPHRSLFRATGVVRHAEDFNKPFSADINGNRVWWVDTGATTGTREKTDMLLYSRDDLTAGQFEPFVECGSCHDPHNSSTFVAN